MPRALLAALALTLVLAGPATAAPTIAAAGDIAPHSGPAASTDTAALIREAGPTAVLTLGDNQYSDGTLEEFLGSYDRSWGEFLSITRPSPGNHDYHTPGAAGYKAYFGDRATPDGRTYYSRDLGAWHLVALDSNLNVDPGSPQHEWLEADLARHPAECTLAYWHHPRWSSGTHHGSDRSVQPLWDALTAAGADVVLNGHEHNYERFGRRRGVREFVVGTGGASHYGFGDPAPRSQVRIGTEFGILEMTLRPARYRWTFRATSGEALDSGVTACR